MIVTPTAAFAQVDFDADILPIFKQHCFECHADGNFEGQLKLDSISGIKRGGHTGNALLAKNLADSELYLRISSTSDGYRMPKKGESLSEEEIEKVAAWIQGYVDVADEPEVSEPQAEEDDVPEVLSSPNVSVTPPKRESDSDSASSDSGMLNSFGLGKSGNSEYAIIFGAVVVVLLLGWLFLQSSGKRRKSKSIDDLDMGRSPRALGWTLLGVINALLLFGIGYYYNRANTLEKENLRLAEKGSSSGPVIPAATIVSASSLPMPPHPMHPTRLGGTYYRGNDERDETLFNGGFYRTATIDLHLIDSAANRLGWGDDLSAGQAVEIVIERAPKATRELFTERVLNSISIEHFCQTDSKIVESQKFEVVEEEQTWRAVVSLPESQSWNDGRMHGMIYLMYGVQPGEERLPRPHFGIRYDLKIAGSKLAESSDLWMGSLYTLGGRVLVPEKGQVLLDRWFDWRPIPVIDGAASNDPKLLGLPEHTK